VAAFLVYAELIVWYMKVIAVYILFCDIFCKAIVYWN